MRAPSSRQGEGRYHKCFEHDHLGKPFRHSVSGFLQRENRRARGNEVIGDEKWLKETFISTVQQRGAAIIKARGLSSAASAANAVVDTVRSLVKDTLANDWHSVAVCSDGSYGVERN